MTSITFILEAEEEMNYSAQYYNQQALGLGMVFLEEIEKSLEHVNDALGMDILQKLEKGLVVKKESIKLYFDFHEIKKP